MSEQTIREVLNAARLLFQAGDVVEVRVPKARRQKVISGYFDDFQALAQVVDQIEHTRPAVPGIYWTINPVRPEIMSRAVNRAKPYAEATTSGDEILRRCWIPIDFDPVRPKEISSDEQEHAAALQLAELVELKLCEAGWPEPIRADSGNGAHALYRVDLPNDDQSTELVQGVLKALALRFNTPAVKVDLQIFDANRILKIYGTTARKGDHTAERPHRVSRILRVPALVQPVPIEKLREIAVKAPTPISGAPRPRPVGQRGPTQNEFDLRRFLDKHGIRYRDPAAYDGGYKFTLEACPFDGSHQGKDAAVFERSDGYGFKCFHDSCSGRGWKEFRELFEPAAYSGRVAGGRSPTRYPANPAPEVVPRDEDVPPVDERTEEEIGAEDVKAAVDQAIADGNLDAVLLLVPEIARLAPLMVLRIKTALADKFKRRFRIRDFEQQIRDERRRGIAGFCPVDSSLPVIVVNNRPMRDVVADSLGALRAANDPPFLFVRSGQMVFAEIDERQRPSIHGVEKAHLRGRLDRAANYIRRGAEADIAVPPPIEVVEDILALPSAQWGVPPLEIVVEVPTLREDGTVLCAPGYDPISRMLYAPAPGFVLEAIPAIVDSADVELATALIDEAIGDFPFAEEKDDKGVTLAANPSRANMYALLLTPIVRPAIAGVVPLALIDAPQAGTGKSLLVDLFSIITTGRSAAMMPFPRNEEEMAKSIGATLLAGGALVCFDNIEGILQSPTLSLVLTAKEYQTRILGVSENMIAPNRATWVATGNNIRPSGDMPRRCYHIRLDARKSRPYQGRKFQHENLLEWAQEVRPKLLRALLIIARSWYQRKTKAQPPDSWGSFEAWQRAMWGILRSSGIEGFLTNMPAFLAEGDDMAVQWEAFLREVEEFFDNRWFTVGKIITEVRTPATALAPAPFTLPDSLADVDRRKEGSLERALGKSFAKRIGTRFGENELHIERRFQKHTKQAEWRVLTRQTESLSEPAATPS